MRKDKSEYQAKVTVDTGMARARVPTPLLSRMGARPGNYIIFRLVSTGEAIMRLSRSAKKSGTERSKRR